jgi:Flp pilus assembly protein TadG
VYSQFWGKALQVKPYIKHHLGAFFRNREGNGSVEFVILLPAFILLLSLVTDVALIFHGQARTLRILQDANRGFSIGWLTTEAETTDYIQAALANISPGAIVTTSVDAGVIKSSATIPASDLDALGFLTALADASFTVRSEHVVEY